jgi:succinate dehydrogenase / fumarate reductase cytochrome b subunit
MGKRRPRYKAGILAGLTPFRLNLERWAYTLHRLTGIGLLLYFVGHLIETGTIVGGPGEWVATLHFTQNPFGHTILLLVILALGFHGVNGIRLTLAEFGLIGGPPARPEFPYRARSLGAMQRLLFWTAVVMTLAAGAYAWLLLFGG